MLVRIAERGRKIVEFLETYQTQHGYPPSIREIGKAVGISSTSVVSYNLDRLMEAGLIKKLDRTGRNIAGVNEADLVPARRMLSIRPPNYRTRGRRPKATVDASTALVYFKGCAYCGDTRGLVQRDHFVPISRGGTESINNLLPSCRSCNLDKSDKEPVAWVLASYGPDILAKIVHYLCTVTVST